ncbi:hypothetical protein G647_04649 [Cladophialophora carrionii CBS 160.54]|uniref:F-box domain-containing protein n=1 Tax=Cladophialophora carrionii CBS 160.54 TaxID=1279043 RepID=V9DEE8_9EURO|nr:uncharacterized protein G647_04649 [Cladophialophora carrionii CBS 160.54]ETI25274.1 hypothetical protein G647_04649 [Cladophialophora carrionii CBS 160.54]
MPSPLTDLPDEVLQVILSYLPPLSNIALQQTCRHFADIANEPLLWKDYCQQTFKWWDGRHAFEPRLRETSFTGWKDLFAERHRTSRSTRNAVDKIVAEELGRLDSLKVVLEAGYDAKQDLLDMYWNAASSPNCLAQRYWSHAALGCLHRLMAVREWTAVKQRDSVNSYERSLGAFDLFILEEQLEGDLSDIHARLTSYAASVRQAHPDIDELSPRQKAVVIAEHLRDNQWIGIHGNRHYHSLDHMFLGVALFSKNRNSVPLISAIIYCHVARQFNLRAAPCSYPFHVQALVQPPPGFDLDGNQLSESANGAPSKSTHLYMDPFNSSEPVSLSKLEAQLKFITPTASPAQTASYLSAASARDLSIRAAHNILSSPSHDPGLPVHPINPNLATYAALFSLVILPSHPLDHPAQMRQHLAVLTQHFLEYFDLDIHLFETHVLPLAYALPDSRAYRNLISQLKDADHESRTPKYRSDERNAIVEYKVGQVFRHRRRGYLAVIYGWDHYCRMQEQWITMNQVDRLPHGRNQPFYNVLVEDESTRYVAQENVVLLSAEEITEQHVNAFPIEIGKWFKRYDPDTGTFVSNVKDEYPEG